MKSCIVLYDGISMLSFAKIYDFFIANSVDFEVASLREEITCEGSFKLNSPNYSQSLYGYDIVVFPDGTGALNLSYDDIFLSWIKSANDAKIKIAINRASLIIKEAGLFHRQLFMNDDKVTAICEFCVDKDVISMADTSASWQELKEWIKSRV
ncbi:hypothetical protein Q4Y15_000875 [Campylobacter fetus]|uniref:DJ-1/PfpI domain-containing protein n=3 Tax=Campylobacter fetus TaxID=196 RepID=A0AAE6IY63_CAMFE|nr:MULTISPECIES: hypothetical protein [Campylobacter]AIR79764.1 hypothetical protein CFV97608_0087 [Campylobacter fetus subsp. venerealis 97/608]EFU4396099.1 hypothetical protein [Campylobacter fetus]EJB7569539.1 hypothetical protein [Campylobacter fetus]EJC3760155.1 hypothetical protein [Campylobacter fetus]EJC3775828.1 hypothetical protein [Campylobacter fetus]